MKLPFAAVCLSLAPALFGQPAMPEWLAPYPGATAQTKTFPALVETTYTTAAAPGAVADHYRKLFAAQNLPFQPNSDGIGTVVRASAAGCDLLITIHPQDAGSLVRVSCAAKSESTGGYRAESSAIAGIPGSVMDRHRQLVEQMGIHREYQDAPAPPLVWPNWLVQVRGGALTAQPGADRAGNAYLQTKYVTSAPMTQLAGFYADLLTAHEYSVYHSELTTGQTRTRVRQNAFGKIEGSNYPNGFPGPRTEITIHFDRTHLNDPVTVILRFTTFDFKAPKRGF